MFGVSGLYIYGQGQRPCPFDFLYCYPLLSVLPNYAKGSFVCSFSLFSIAGELKEGFPIELFVCFRGQHALTMEAAILEAACQCLCVDFNIFHSGSCFLARRLYRYCLMLL